MSETTVAKRPTPDPTGLHIGDNEYGDDLFAEEQQLSQDTLRDLDRIMAEARQGRAQTSVDEARKSEPTRGFTIYALATTGRPRGEMSENQFTAQFKFFLLTVPTRGDEVVGRGNDGHTAMLRVVGKPRKDYRAFLENTGRSGEVYAPVPGEIKELRRFETTFVALNVGKGNRNPRLPTDCVLKLKGVRAIADLKGDAQPHYTAIEAEQWSRLDLKRTDLFYLFRNKGLFTAALSREEWTECYSNEWNERFGGPMHLLRIHPSPPARLICRQTHPNSVFSSTINTVQELVPTSSSFVDEDGRDADRALRVHTKLAVLCKHAPGGPGGQSIADAMRLSAETGVRQYRTALWTVEMWAEKLGGSGVRAPAVWGDVAPWMLHGMDIIVGAHVDQLTTTCTSVNQPDFDHSDIDYGLDFTRVSLNFSDLSNLARATGVQVSADFAASADCADRYGTVRCKPEHAMPQEGDLPMCLTDAPSREAALDKVSGGNCDLFAVPIVDFSKTKHSFYSILRALRRVQKAGLEAVAKLLSGGVYELDDIELSKEDRGFLTAVAPGQFHVFAVAKRGEGRDRSIPPFFIEAIQQKLPETLPLYRDGKLITAGAAASSAPQEPEAKRARPEEAPTVEEPDPMDIDSGDESDAIL
jgi:hypothetical protein